MLDVQPSFPTARPAQPDATSLPLYRNLGYTLPHSASPLGLETQDLRAMVTASLSSPRDQDWGHDDSTWFNTWRALSEWEGYREPQL